MSRDPRPALDTYPIPSAVDNPALAEGLLTPKVDFAGFHLMGDAAVVTPAPVKPKCERCGGHGFDPEDSVEGLLSGAPEPAACRDCGGMGYPSDRYEYDP